jgi:outer membrane beta-barrel protein
MTHDRRPPASACVLALALLLGASAPLRAQSADSTGATPPASPDAPVEAGAAAPGSSADGAASAPPPAAAPPENSLTTQRRVRLDRDSHNVLRTGPGAGFAIVGVYPKGASFVVIAKSAEWYNVRVSDTVTGWVHASLCREYDDLSDLEYRPNPKVYNRAGTFIAGGYGGAYAFDRKSNSLVLGGRLGYYVFDRIQVEGGGSWTHIHRPAEIVESLFGLTLEAEDFQMLFYHLNVTWEILPGRQMVPFLTAGVGSAIMRGETEPSYNLGAGTTLYLSKRMATRWEVRDYRFSTGPDASRVANDNVEFSLGTFFLF